MTDPLVALTIAVVLLAAGLYTFALLIEAQSKRITELEKQVALLLKGKP